MSVTAPTVGNKSPFDLSDLTFRRSEYPDLRAGRLSSAPGRLLVLFLPSGRSGVNCS